ncbi:SufE family protein [Metallibacterium sp.]|uniref:SufE family protein n=1 Tax=Metallibacterium sp. TaxID=2940281 RepID=UPI0026281566|nr:SufE family protein [Metallibacterium sp.]
MTSPTPPAPQESTAAAAAQAIVEEFALFGDWSERYQYLIDLGKKLPDLPAELKTEEHRVQGCQSLVWMQGHGDATRLDFEAISDSAIVSGLIALLLRVYSGRCAREIMDTEPEFIRAIGLAKALSPTRANGLAAMLKKIRAQAAAQLQSN